MKTKTRKKQGKPRPVILADIVERVVRAAEPEKIVLFGSAARVTMGPDSDYDLLVLKGGGVCPKPLWPRSPTRTFRLRSTERRQMKSKSGALT